MKRNLIAALASLLFAGLFLGTVLSDRQFYDEYYLKSFYKELLASTAFPLTFGEQEVVISKDKGWGFYVANAIPKGGRTYEDAYVYLIYLRIHARNSDPRRSVTFDGHLRYELDPDDLTHITILEWVPRKINRKRGKWPELGEN